MYYYKVELSYDGSQYYGWQTQKDNKQTIQGQIDNCLKKVFKDEFVKTIGASRTDAGVHALGQVFRIDLKKKIPLNGLMKILNDQTPRDIKINHIVYTDESFHPVFSAKMKTYKYYFRSQSKSKKLKEKVFEYNHIAETYLDLNLLKMQKASKCFIGEWSFKNYFNKGTPVKSLIRDIKECSVEKIKYSNPLKENLDQELYVLTITGNGFLKQMVRLIVGTIWAYSHGKISISEIQKSLEIPENLSLVCAESPKDWAGQKKLGIVAPSEGLYLYKIYY